MSNETKFTVKIPKMQDEILIKHLLNNFISSDAPEIISFIMSTYAALSILQTGQNIANRNKHHPFYFLIVGVTYEIIQRVPNKRFKKNIISLKKVENKFE